MKVLLIVVYAFLGSHSFSQGELPTKDGKVYYEVVDSSIKGLAGSLYNKAKMWFADAFRDSKEVIQVDDKENNTIMGKGLFRFSQGPAPYICRFSVKIMTKENKYRAQFYDLIIEAGTAGIKYPVEFYNEKKSYDKIKSKINENILATIEDLKKSMSAKADNDF